MEAAKVSELFKDLIKDYEKVENFYICICSENKERDFRILDRKVKEYNERLNELLGNGHKGTKQTGTGAGEGDIQEEPLRIL